MMEFFAQWESALFAAQGADAPAECEGKKPLPTQPATAERGKMFLIEGLDLAGKSTLVRNLQAELTSRGIPVRVSRNALCPNNPIAALADELRRDPKASLIETGALFLGAHLWDERHFEPPPAGTVHLQDSCWLRTLAYHTWKGTPAIPEQLARAARYFPRFDTAVFLTADIEERKRRLLKRERDQPGSNDANDDLVQLDPRSYLRLEQVLAQLAAVYTKATEIDTGVQAERLVPLLAEILTRATLTGGIP